jgi:uncharacterized protein (TIGR02001 family)
MKKTAALLSLSALALGTAAMPATSFAGTTGNVGFVTDYVFRGILQAPSSGYAGADWSGDKGLYVGTWWADVNQGAETDFYGGWMGGGENVKFKIGATLYRYFDDFDGNYDEVNLGLYAGIFALDIAAGTYDGDQFYKGDPVRGGNQDYIFTSVTITPKNGPYYKVGFWSGDYKDNIISFKDTSHDAYYAEIGYDYKLEDQGIDLTVAFTWAPDLFVNSGTGDYNIVFGIKKTFEKKK